MYENFSLAGYERGSGKHDQTEGCHKSEVETMKLLTQTIVLTIGVAVYGRRLSPSHERRQQAPPGNERRPPTARHKRRPR